MSEAWQGFYVLEGIDGAGKSAAIGQLKELCMKKGKGAVESYVRRYLYLTAFEIVEADCLDAMQGNPQNAQAAQKPTAKPAQQAPAQKPSGRQASAKAAPSKQNGTAFKIISLLFESQEGRKPTEGEKKALDYDLLETHADRVPVRDGVRLRPVHLSEATTEQAARFIDGLLFELVECSDLPQDLQADARQVIYEREAWRGQQKEDFTASMTEREAQARRRLWRARAVYSEASGLGGQIELHHILPKGSHPQFRDKAENLVKNSALFLGEGDWMGWTPGGRLQTARKLAQQAHEDIRQLLEQMRKLEDGNYAN